MYQFSYSFGIRNWTHVNPFPVPSLQSFASDLTVIEVEGSYYFKALVGDNLLITGYDFPAGWVKGFPYKSAATIDAFGQTGLTVSALFQNFDYANQYFTKHVAQVVDGNGVETSQGYVSSIVAYSEPLTGADLTAVNTFYVVPTEDTTTMAWLAPDGDDSTGDGSKLTPYRSIDKIKASTKTNIYLKTGTYDLAATLSFTGATKLNLIAVGKVSFAFASMSVGFTVSRELLFKGCSIDGNLANYTMDVRNQIEFLNCKITKTAGVAFLLPATGMSAKNITFTNCINNVTTADGLIKNSTAINNFVLQACFGIINAGLSASYVTNAAVIANNKVTGTSNPVFTAKNITYKNNTGFTTITLNSTTDTLVFANQTLTDRLILSGKYSVNNCTINGYLKGVAYNDQQITGNSIYAPNNTYGLYIQATNDANVTGLVIDSNTVIGNSAASYIVCVIGSNELGYNAINAVIIKRNRIVNLSTANTGGCHTLFVGGGIDNSIKYNDITANNGYAIVIKSAGRHYTTTDEHISYNTLRFTGNCSYAILCKGAYGVISGNNTVIDFKNDTVFAVTTESGFDSSMLVINNLVKLGASTNYLSTGTGITSRNNVINKMGFTLSNAIGANDFESIVAIDSNGVPASKIENAEEVTGDNNIGLASNYVIPSAITYQNQGATWQNGAVILP